MLMVSSSSAPDLTFFASCSPAACCALCCVCARLLSLFPLLLCPLTAFALLLRPHPVSGTGVERSEQQSSSRLLSGQTDDAQPSPGVNVVVTRDSYRVSRLTAIHNC